MYGPFTKDSKSEIRYLLADDTKEKMGHLIMDGGI